MTWFAFGLAAAFAVCWALEYKERKDWEKACKVLEVQLERGRKVMEQTAHWLN